jgi:hypothetical protein
MYPVPGPTPPGYQPGFVSPALKPGIIPLRPLSLSDIFNGSVGYIRTNPKATLGLTAIVVVSTQILALILQVWPLAMAGNLGAVQGGPAAAAASPLGGITLGTIAGAIASILAGILLSGMLTVVVGRAIFGSHITIAETWQKIRGRLWPLLGLTALILAGFLLVGMSVALLIFGVSLVAGTALTVIFGAVLVVGTLIGVTYLVVALTFAPAIVVLERKSIIASIRRSMSLIRNRFWRVLGIRMLAGLVATLLAGAVTVPFSIASEIVLFNPDSVASVLLGTTIATVGAAIAQIIVAPFSAGVEVLLYADSRIRAEAFDLVLQTGMTAAAVQLNSTDDLWLSPTG